MKRCRVVNADAVIVSPVVLGCCLEKEVGRNTVVDTSWSESTQVRMLCRDERMKVILELEEMCLDAKPVEYWAVMLDNVASEAAAVVIPAYVMRSSAMYLIRRLNMHSRLLG